jgi:hypothetical protein
MVAKRLAQKMAMGCSREEDREAASRYSPTIQVGTGEAVYNHGKKN